MSMLLLHEAGPAARLAVFAYDLGDPRRARRARRVLQALKSAAQYSVFELWLSEGRARGVLAELAHACNLGEDRLALWWPAQGRSWRLSRAQLLPAVSALPALTELGRLGATPLDHDALNGNFNFMLSYDVHDPRALQRLGRAVAPVAVQVQRSVYWLRMPSSELRALLHRWSRLLGDEDRLWVHPLRRAADLWRIDAADLARPSCLLPVRADNRARLHNDVQTALHSDAATPQRSSIPTSRSS